MRVKTFSALVGLLVFCLPNPAPAEPAGARSWTSAPGGSQAVRVARTTQSEPELPAMIGQMLMVGFRGKTARSPGARAAARDLREGRIGGVLLMGHNIASGRYLRELTGLMQRATPKNLPGLIAVDQEGGHVQRLGPRHGYRSYPSAARLARRGTPEVARRHYADMARELASHGINLNLGPVVDLNINPANPIIARKRRSYSADAEIVVSYARAFISAHRQAGVLTAVKHFPGHGSSWADSHRQFVDLSSSWQPSELVPYRELNRGDPPGIVMTGHLYHPAFSDGGRLPASLSGRAIDRRLRGEIGFDGVVLTDDLGMAAIRENYSLAESVVRAVKAGNDILLFANPLQHRDLIGRVHAILRKAVARGDVAIERIRSSYDRIRRLKTRLAKPASTH